eukprot:11516449-Ditylum_brightwellii.AAC.1
MEVDLSGMRVRAYAQLVRIANAMYFFRRILPMNSKKPRFAFIFDDHYRSMCDMNILHKMHFANRKFFNSKPAGILVDSFLFQRRCTALWRGEKYQIPGL